jgi:hypothetical protein
VASVARALLSLAAADDADARRRRLRGLRAQARRDPAHASQLHDPQSKEPLTTISAPGFLEAVTAAHRHFGAMIGVTYAEPYLVEGPLAVDDPLPLLRGRGEGQFGSGRGGGDGGRGA